MAKMRIKFRVTAHHGACGCYEQGKVYEASEADVADIKAADGFVPKDWAKTHMDAGNAYSFTPTVEAAEKKRVAASEKAEKERLAREQRGDAHAAPTTEDDLEDEDLDDDDLEEEDDDLEDDDLEDD